MDTSNAFAFAFRQWHVLAACWTSAVLAFAVSELWIRKPVFLAETECHLDAEVTGDAALRNHLRECETLRGTSEVAFRWRPASGGLSLASASRDRNSAEALVSSTASALLERISSGFRRLQERTLSEIYSERARVEHDRSISLQEAALMTGTQASGFADRVRRADQSLARLDLARRELRAEDFADHARKKLRLDEGARRTTRQRPGSRGRLSMLLMSTFLVSLLAAWLVQRSDTRFFSTLETRKRLRMPVLGGIPRLSKEAVADPCWALSTPVFADVASSVERAAREGELRSILIASALRGEGKTTVALGLGSALATRGLRVILVDGNLKAPSLHGVLGLAPRMGLFELLERSSGGAGFSTPESAPSLSDEAILDCILAVQGGGLGLVAASSRSESDVRWPTVESLRSLLLRLGRNADLVICDSDALCAGPSGRLLANCTDGALLVLEAGKTESEDVSRARIHLRGAQASLVGVVLNGIQNESGRDCSHARIPGTEPELEYLKETV